MPHLGSDHRNDRDTLGEPGNHTTTGHLHRPRHDDLTTTANEGTGTQGTYDNSGRTHQPYHGAPNYPQPAQVPPGDNTAYVPNQTSSGVQYRGTYGNPGAHQGSTGTKVAGKLQSALGSIVGSKSLEAKGLAKEREANSVNLQAAELAEAQRLEHEAMLHRQKAVSLGAHPANANPPGVGQFGAPGYFHGQQGLHPSNVNPGAGQYGGPTQPGGYPHGQHGHPANMNPGVGGAPTQTGGYPHQ